jgi:hypothetical protein
MNKLSDVNGFYSSEHKKRWNVRAKKRVANAKNYLVCNFTHDTVVLVEKRDCYVKQRDMTQK